ncbi:ribosomal L1 domain-containing protein CG13096-like [Ostrinia furnacalis]|uniref:ribosomal L1 domain-containing protein CG13096-like n=1 Tax=Ostrinia furnacalis TaxID=93504 RepID=UPI00103D4083|nr:ribosomal L1 domain-containing protein CG13096-like [Ostrinia furnacalis]
MVSSKKADVKKRPVLKMKPEKVKVKKQSTGKTKTTVEKILTQTEEKKPKKDVLKTIIKDQQNVAPKTKFVMPSKNIKEANVDLCLAALEQVATNTKNKNAIFDDETQIFAEINCIKIQTTTGNIKFVLPHSTAASTGEICLITPDLKKGKKIDHEPTVDHWEEKLRQANVTCVKTVLPMRQLRVEYDQFELKRRLLTQHDFIMVDTSILSHVSHLLGKMFFKKHNMLIPVRLHKKEDIKKSIDLGLRTAMLRLAEGATSVIVVGHTGMPRQKVKENVLSLVQQLRDKYPGGEANIRSISLKLPLSLAVPLYLTLRPSNSITQPRLVRNKPKNFRILEDELSTIPNSTVRVAPDGTVQVNKLGKETSDSEDNEMDQKEDKEEANASDDE